MIDPTRVHRLNDLPARSGGKFVLYWMQQSQRAQFNHALEYAIARGNELKLPVVVGFGLMDDYPEANERHYAFMLEGLRDVASDLNKRDIRFVVRHGQPQEVAVALAKHAAAVVCDKGYLRHQRRWRDFVADHAGREVVEVESDVVVPVDVASNKQEYAARTIRPRIHRTWEQYLVPLKPGNVQMPSADLALPGDEGKQAIDPEDVEGNLRRLKIDRSVPRSGRLVGGSTSAHKRLKAFLADRLKGYDDGRNEPSVEHTSMMSAYLHFGQISPVELALAVREAPHAPAADRDAYLEELIVRRELSANFVYHSPHYDSFDCIPDWAKKTLREHESDERPHHYDRDTMEQGKTKDPYWNAAQQEMVTTGFMHNYMRMYWGKKILEWSKTPRLAYDTTIYLNNKYFIDGRDPNAYGNVAWIYGLHDRPWGPARKIFGTVRYMNAAGLERKFDMKAYVAKWG